MSGDSGDIDVRAAADLLDVFSAIGVEEHEEIGDVVEAVSILDAFAKVPGRVERMPTFMEIGGYPHYENVCSNFLAFFLDPEEVHGLGTLFLDALMETAGVSDEGGGFGGAVEVGREIVTSNGNRIDILVRSDTHVVLIENKIFAAATNPFYDYAAYVDQLRDPEGAAYENKIKILLTLYPSNEAEEQSFVNVTHSKMVRTIRYKKEHELPDADGRYSTLMLDFLDTLQNLGEGTRMNQEFIKLLGDRESEVEKFLKSLDAVRAEMRNKARELGHLIDVQSLENVQKGDWRPKILLHHCLWLTVYKDGKQYIGIDAAISPSGWQIQFFPREAGSWPEVISALEAAEIPFEEGKRFIYPTKFDYDEDLTVIAPVVKGLVEKIAAHHG